MVNAICSIHLMLSIKNLILFSPGKQAVLYALSMESLGSLMWPN